MLKKIVLIGFPIFLNFCVNWDLPRHKTLQITSRFVSVVNDWYSRSLGISISYLFLISQG